MEFTDDDVSRFRNLWKEEYGEELSEEEGLIELRRFMGAFMLLAGPVWKRPDQDNQ